MSQELKIPVGKSIGLVVILVAAVLLLTSATRIVETVNKGTYVIKQAAVTGTMSAHMTPGMFMQNFGDVKTWDKAETFYFTHDHDEGAAKEQSIEVRFNDGSLCKISGTLRVMLPTSESQALDLVTVDSYQSYDDLEQKLILPTVRNALRLTANLMSARESYSEKRTDFVFQAWDQIQNGLYETSEITKKVKDEVSGEMVTRTLKVVKTDGEGGPPIYQHDPLKGKGIVLANFEVKTFEYAQKVKEQIAAQQSAYMSVATAKAKAQQAEQSKLQMIAEGKARVAQAQYQQEELKIKAVVEAEKVKAVAILGAEQKRDTAKLDKEAAAFYKAEQELRGKGDAAYKKAVMTADGALAPKLAAYKEVQQMWANAYATRKVPQAVISSGGGNGNQDAEMTGFQQLMTTMALKQLGLDMSIQK